MLEEYAETLAVTAATVGVLVSLTYIPQIYKIWKRKSVNDLSLPLFLSAWVSLVVWTIYGISIANWPLIIADAVGAVGCGIVVVQYFKYRK